MSKIGLIWATNQHDVFSKDGGIPWKCSGDLKHFKEVTEGSSIIMGRKTWESLPFKPLKNRKNIVITRTPRYRLKAVPFTDFEGVITEQDTVDLYPTEVDVYHSLSQALAREQELGNDVWIIGGRGLLKEGFEYADHIWHTSVLTDEIDGGEKLDIKYYEDSDWVLVQEKAEHDWAAKYLIKRIG